MHQALNAHSELIKNKNHGTLTVEKVTSIYNGDTFRANIAGLHSLIGESISIRVAGVGTPEMRGKRKQEKDLARQAKQVTVEALRSAKVIELRNTKRGKYFRIVADVYVDDKNLTDILISSGLGVVYESGTKAKDWCG
ncbi:thermonuclease family protein [Pseudoalteromonas sp. NZS100_1]|nr:thermonuclease family protein [Pseudoalteromonas sp. NZS100_1]